MTTTITTTANTTTTTTTKMTTKTTTTKMSTKTTTTKTTTKTITTSKWSHLVHPRNSSSFELGHVLYIPLLFDPIPTHHPIPTVNSNVISTATPTRFRQWRHRRRRAKESSTPSIRSSAASNSKERRKGRKRKRKKSAGRNPRENQPTAISVDKKKHVAVRIQLVISLSFDTVLFRFYCWYIPPPFSRPMARQIYIFPYHGVVDIFPYHCAKICCTDV